MGRNPKYCLKQTVPATFDSFNKLCVLENANYANLGLHFTMECMTGNYCFTCGVFVCVRARLHGACEQISCHFFLTYKVPKRNEI